MTETVYAAGTVPLLEVDGVNKTFPGVRALSDMRLDLRAGEVLALVGENGAGKSTLMKLLSGIYSADTGSFRLFGRPLTITGPKHAMELGISIIHQEFNLVPHLTVAQNIFIGREPRLLRVLLDERRLVANARELIERLHLPLDPTALVGGLTVANQQMVEIAKALSYDPKVLIMDEPTAALNEAEVATLHELIRRFVRPDTGVIYISHRMEEIKRIADRVTVIRDGQYVDTMDVATSSTREIISLMVGRTIDGGAGPQDVRDDREVLLEVMGLSTRTLLKDVSFDLRAGEILGFAGLMGAGRTETARAIVGADPATGGTILLRGRPVRMGHPADAVRHGIGYLSEDRKRYGLLLDKDVRTNVTLGALRDRFAKAGFINDRAARAKAKEYVGALKIKTPSVEQTTKFLSGGNQQKVVIAKWLVRDCEILIFDEPTRGIDVGAKEEIYDLLNELAAQGKSIIMISSELPEVLRMSHRVVVMSEGRVTQILTAAEATQESIMHYATLRPDENVEDAMELGLDPVETGAVAAEVPTGGPDVGGAGLAGGGAELGPSSGEPTAGGSGRAGIDGGLSAGGAEPGAGGGAPATGRAELDVGGGLAAGGAELGADGGERAGSGGGLSVGGTELGAGSGKPAGSGGEPAAGGGVPAAGGGAPDPGGAEPAAHGDEEGER